MNGLASSAMKIRSLLKSTSWQIKACLQVSVWSGSKMIQFAIELELNIASFYLQELNWYRKSSSRPYLCNYPVLYRARELPGHCHNVPRKFLQELVADPKKKLSKVCDHHDPSHHDVTERTAMN
jgi:hypothetical protein